MYTYNQYFKIFCRIYTLCNVSIFVHVSREVYLLCYMAECRKHVIFVIFQRYWNTVQKRKKKSEKNSFFRQQFLKNIPKANFNYVSKRSFTSSSFNGFLRVYLRIVFVRRFRENVLIMFLTLRIDRI